MYLCMYACTYATIRIYVCTYNNGLWFGGVHPCLCGI